MATKENVKTSLDQELGELARLRDEIRLKVHLAGLDAKSAWKALEPRLDELEHEAKKEGEVVRRASVFLARDLKKAFVEFRSRLI